MTVASVTITVNGASRTVAAGTTIADLLVSLGLEGAAVAVACNDRVVRRADHATATLHEGDRVEIIRAVAGG